MNRPVLWAALAFSGGIAALGAGTAPGPLAAAAALLLLALYLAPSRIAYRDGFLVALVFFLAGGAWAAIRAPERRGDPLASYVRNFSDRLYTLEGTIAEAPLYTTDSEYLALRLRVEAASEGGRAVPVPGGVLVRWTDPTGPLYPGEKVRVRGRLSPELGEVNLGMGGVEDYYRNHGYHSTLRARGGAVERIATPTFHVRYWAARLRQWESEVFARTAPPETVPLLRAVWLGERGGVSHAGRDAFLKTGTAHILAVSGVHVGIVYLTLQLALRGAIRNRKYRAAVILGAVIIFALVTGARTPILRATTMLALYLWAEFLDREPDAPTALSLAALLFLVHNPALLDDTGFRLSFTSLGSLLLFSRPIADRLAALPYWLRHNLGATVGVTILPLPLTAHTFHILSAVGPLCNLFVIPLLGALLWLCLLTVAVAPLSLDVAALFGHATYPVAWAISAVSEWGAAIPGGHRIATSPTPVACLAYGAMALALYRWLLGDPRPRRWLAIAAVAAAATWLLWQPLHRPATVDILDVGHGDALFVRTPGGTTLLMDGGNRSEFVDLGARTVVPWLLSQGVRHLDYVVVSHPDQDHIGGLQAVLEQIGVGAVILGLWDDERAVAQALIAQCAALAIPVRQVGRGDTLAAAGAHIAVLHPDPGRPHAGVNDNSVVLHVAWAGLDTLLAGDIEVEAERLLLPHLPRVDLLKVPHHGSFTSSSAPFLDAVAPQIAVISTRAGANRDAVAPDVAQRYADRGIPVFRTDYHGGVRVRQRGGALHITTARGQRGYTLAPGEL